MTFSYLIGIDGTIYSICDNKSLPIINKTHANYPKIKNLINNGKFRTDEEIKQICDLVDIKKTITNYSNNKITINKEILKYKDTPLEDVVVDKLLELIRQNCPVQPLINFLDKLLENVSRNSVKELYKFLSHQYLPITIDGDFIACKSVDTNYRDHYSGKFDNSPGVINSIKRNAVDDNIKNKCSYGFHVGTLKYAYDFCRCNRKIMAVKVNPADVVSVNHDAKFEKIRVCKYMVLTEIADQEICEKEQCGELANMLNVPIFNEHYERHG